MFATTGHIAYVALINYKVDDIISVMEFTPMRTNTKVSYKVYNFGKKSFVSHRFIFAIETATGEKANELLPHMQFFDVPTTSTDLDKLMRDISFKSEKSIDDGSTKSIDCFKGFYA